MLFLGALPFTVMVTSKAISIFSIFANGIVQATGEALAEHDACAVLADLIFSKLPEIHPARLHRQNSGQLEPLLIVLLMLPMLIERLL